MDQAEYTTNDPYLASFVVSEGGVLVGCRRLGPKKVEFRFTPSRQLHRILRVYWSGLPVHVTPYRLFAALRMLKSRTLVGPGVEPSHTSSTGGQGVNGTDAIPGNGQASPPSAR
jgi:hypothetical protein